MLPHWAGIGNESIQVSPTDGRTWGTRPRGWAPTLLAIPTEKSRGNPPELLRRELQNVDFSFPPEACPLRLNLDRADLS